MASEWSAISAAPNSTTSIPGPGSGRRTMPTRMTSTPAAMLSHFLSAPQGTSRRRA